MSMDRNRSRFAFFILAMLITLSLYSWKAETCFAPDELFYYKGSQSLSDPRNLFGPEYYGEHRFQKPPLFYLLVFLSFKFFGINWFAARLPAILSSIGLLTMTYLLGLKMFGDKDKAFFGAALLGTSALFFRFGRIALPEMTFIFFMTAAIYFAYRAFLENRRTFFYPSFLFMGIGFLIKGPIALIVPCLSIIIFRIITPKSVYPVGIPWFRGLLIILAFNLLWLIPSLVIYKESFLTHILKDEIAYRVVGTGQAATFHSYFSGYIKRFTFYPGAVLTQFLPWSALATIFLIVEHRKLEKRSFARQRSFLIIWLLAGFFTFASIAARRFHYVLTLFPALSMLLVSYFDFSRINVKRIFTSAVITAISVYLVATAAFLPLIFSDGVDRLSARLNDELKIRGAASAVSWRVDYQKVQLHIDRPLHVITCAEFTDYSYTKGAIEDIINKSPKKTPSFYVIAAKEEYDQYFKNFILMAERVYKTPLIFHKIAEDWRWRKKIKLKDFLNNILKDPGMAMEHFKTAFQEEVLLIYARGD